VLARIALGVVLGMPLAARLLAQSTAATSPPPVKLSGYIQARETYQERVGLVGTINRARLAASGSLPSNFSWRIQGEFRTGNVGTGRASVSLQDGYIRWTHNRLGLQLGQYKTPFTREFITSLTEVETADRSTVVDSLAPKRDIGLMADYAFGGRTTVSLGVFNGEGQNITAKTDSSSVLGIARIAVRPIPYLALGLNAARYFARDSADSTRYGADMNVEAPWIILRAEYVGQHHNQVTGGEDKGWYALAAAPLRPWVQPVLKVEWFDRARVPLNAGKNRAWTAAVNFYPWGRTTRMTLEYLSRKIGDPGVRKGTALAQAQLVF
jgi:Phosphate-selective porin O and P